MTSVTKRIVEMIDMLPEDEQKLACEVLKRMVLAWDPDYTKLTLVEEEKLKTALDELRNNETVGHNEVEWK